MSSFRHLIRKLLQPMPKTRHTGMDAGIQAMDGNLPSEPVLDSTDGMVGRFTSLCWIPAVPAGMTNKHPRPIPLLAVPITAIWFPKD